MAYLSSAIPIGPPTGAGTVEFNLKGNMFPLGFFRRRVRGYESALDRAPHSRDLPGFEARRREGYWSGAAPGTAGAIWLCRENRPRVRDLARRNRRAIKPWGFQRTA